MIHREAPTNDIGFLVNKLARAMRSALSDELEDVGITPAQAAVVLALPDTGTVMPTQLADRLGFDRATMTGIVERLARDGWVTVTSNPDDGRSRLIAATGMALDARPALDAASRAVTRIALCGFDERETGLLASMLGLAAENLEAREAVQ